MSVNLLMTNCLVLEVRTGTTKEHSNPFAILRFLCNEDFNVYEVFCFGDSLVVATALTAKETYDLTFEVGPMSGGRAGIRCTLVTARVFDSDLLR